MFNDFGQKKIEELIRLALHSLKKIDNYTIRNIFIIFVNFQQQKNQFFIDLMQIIIFFVGILSLET